MDLLARLLGNMFPLRDRRVVPYHKSVLDWLLSRDGDGRPAASHAFTVDAEVGHALLASACSKLLLGSQLDARVGMAYALRHAVAHACRASGSSELLQALLLDFGVWHAIIKAGECYSSMVSVCLHR